MRALIYTRTSTKEQELGHGAQESLCREHAEAQGWRVEGVWRDQISGGVEVVRREGFMSLLEHARKGDIVLIAKRDRLGRNLVGNAAAESLLLKRGVSLCALDVASGDDPGSVFMRHVIDAVAQYERALISERTRAALAEKVRKGEALGSPKRGYKSDEEGMLVEDAEERMIMEQVRAWRAEGLTITELHERCLDEGLTSRRGEPPSRSTVGGWVQDISVSDEMSVERRGAEPTEPSPQRVESLVVGLKDVILDLSERGLSQRAIVAELARRGYRTRAGRPYSKTQVWRILQRIL